MMLGGVALGCGPTVSTPSSAVDEPDAGVVMREPERLADTVSPRLLRQNASSVFFVDSGLTLRIVRIEKSSGAETTVAMDVFPAAMIVTETDVFFSQIDLPCVDCVLTGSIHVVSVDGGPVATLATMDWVRPTAMDVDEGFIYWFDGNGGKYQRMPIAGGAVETVVAFGLPIVTHLGVVPPRAYYATHQDELRAYDWITKTSKLIAASAGSYACCMKIRDGFLYWKSDGVPPYTIQRVLESGGVTEILANDVRPEGWFDMDDDAVYFTELGPHVGDELVNGRIVRLSVDGAGADDFVTGLESPGEIAVDDTHVYWFAETNDLGGGSLWRVAKK